LRAREGDTCARSEKFDNYLEINFLFLLLPSRNPYLAHFVTRSIFPCIYGFYMYHFPVSEIKKEYQEDVTPKLKASSLALLNLPDLKWMTEEEQQEILMVIQLLRTTLHEDPAASIELPSKQPVIVGERSVPLTKQDPRKTTPSLVKAPSLLRMRSSLVRSPQHSAADVTAAPEKLYRIILKEYAKILREQVSPLVEAEMVSLVAIFHSPGSLVAFDRNWTKAAVPSNFCEILLQNMVRCAKAALSRNNHKQLGKILELLRDLASPEYDFANRHNSGNASVTKYLEREFLKYFGHTTPTRFPTATMQLMLCNSGSVPLIAGLVSRRGQHTILKSVKLGIALLEGGNQRVQGLFFDFFKSSEGRNFFRQIRDEMVNVASELKSKRRIRRGIQTRNSSFLDSYSTITGRESIHREGTEIELSDEEDVEFMTHLLRLLQLFCEGHNSELQDFLREQKQNAETYNIVLETLRFLSSVCGSSVGVLGLFVTENNSLLIKQAMVTLTEYCQGPFVQNQEAILRYNSVEVGIILGILLNEIKPLAEDRPDVVFSLKGVAANLILSLLESRTQLGQHAQLFHEFDVKKIVATLKEIRVIYESWHKFNRDMGYRNMKQEDLLDIGLSLFILLSHLTVLDERIGQEFKEMLQDPKTAVPLSFFQKRTGRVEIVREDELERVYFPIPPLCELLPKKYKDDLVNNVNRHDLLSKLDDFVNRSDGLLAEMKWQLQLQQTPRLRWFSANFSFTRQVSFVITLLLNALILFFFPLEHGLEDGGETTYSLPLYFSFLLFQGLQVLACASVAIGYLSGSSKDLLRNPLESLRDYSSVYFAVYSFVSILSFLVSPYFSCLLVNSFFLWCVGGPFISFLFLFYFYLFIFHLETTSYLMLSSNKKPFRTSSKVLPRMGRPSCLLLSLGLL